MLSRRLTSPLLRFVCLSAVVILGLSVRAESPVERAARGGEVSIVKDHKVLRLKGESISDRGFAHGYLLAEEIRNSVDYAIKSLPFFGVEKFEGKLVPWAATQFDWDTDATQELEGIFAGMQAKLGAEGMNSPVLKRALKLNDLKAINVIADYFGPACSGFAAWGKRTGKDGADGPVIHGRTLDFPIGPEAVAMQMLIVSDPLAQRGDDQPARKGWVAVGWPGLIVEYTGMNADGLVVCIHDGYGPKKGKENGGFVARGLLLRRMLEQIDVKAGDPAEAGGRLASAKPHACGNLFHLTFPAAAAKSAGVPPSAVLEFDGGDTTVDIRRPNVEGSLVLTNHFRTRLAPTECERFRNISAGIESVTKAGMPIALSQARSLLRSAEQMVAAHSVYFFPDTLEMHVALTRGNVLSPRVAPTAFSVKELLK